MSDVSARILARMSVSVSGVGVVEFQLNRPIVHYTVSQKATMMHIITSTHINRFW